MLVRQGNGSRTTKAGTVLAVAVAFCAIGAGSAQAAAAPVAQWRFDDGAVQTVRDDGAFGLDGRLGTTDGGDSADPARVAGVRDGALRFDGNDVVRLPDATELAPATLSVEAVVRAGSSPGHYRYIVSRGGQGCFAGSYGLYTAAAGGVAFYVFDGTGYAVTATARPQDVWNGAWHHVTGTFDGAALRLYVDGREVGTPATSTAPIDYASTNMNAAFGRYVGTCDLSYRGDLDFVRMWSGALGSAEIAAAAAALLPPGAVGPGTPDPLSGAQPPVRLGAEPPKGDARNTPAAPHRACLMRVSRTRLVAGRRARIRVRVTVRGVPAKRVRVVARAHGKRVAVARTGAKGRATLRLRVRRAGRVRISAVVSPACSPARIHVEKR